ncbi:hypothetical protein ACERK3_17675 [Phycisphaerales bacterium AB-hyl4]|uniref:Integral membrane protein n=1 Tax=Natronomicrosphaera hydrolytica TaxID=3242702 RepID=A0ABV4U913_9BACT
MPEATSRFSTATKVKIAVAAVLLALGIVLIMQNLDRVETQIFFWTTPAMPRALLLTLMLLIGFVAGSISTWSYLRRR